MRRDQLEHLIRAAGALLGEDTIIVIGSQAILASVAVPDDAVLTRSMEADLLPADDPDEAKADLIDGLLGAGSMFDDTHGVHADGVSATTAVLPAGWRDRLVEVMNDNPGGVRGLCLEPHDLVISKLVAGRTKDVEFGAADPSWSRSDHTPRRAPRRDRPRRDPTAADPSAPRHLDHAMSAAVDGAAGRAGHGPFQDAATRCEGCHTGPSITDQLTVTY